jgi:transposase InsO family protein
VRGGEERERDDLARRLIRETVVKKAVVRDQLTIRSDRGPAMRSQTVAQLLATLGITKPHSQPHVSNDTPFSESPFKTLKYQPEFPERFVGTFRTTATATASAAARSRHQSARRCPEPPRATTTARH